MDLEAEKNRIFLQKISFNKSLVNHHFDLLVGGAAENKNDFQTRLEWAKSIIIIMLISILTPVFFLILIGLSTSIAVLNLDDDSLIMGTSHIWLMFAIGNCIGGVSSGLVMAFTLQFRKLQPLCAFLIVAVFQTIGSEIAREIFNELGVNDKFLEWRYSLVNVPYNFITVITYWYLYADILKFFLDRIPQDGPNKIMLQLPRAVRGEILVVRALGHYVEIITDRGKHEIKMKFLDAVNELKSSNGMKVHRSYWINMRIVESVKKNGNRYFALTRVGEIPISASVAQDLNLLLAMNVSRPSEVEEPES